MGGAKARTALAGVLTGAAVLAVTACENEQPQARQSRPPEINGVVTSAAPTATSMPPSSKVPQATTVPAPTTAEPDNGAPRRCTANELAVKLGAAAENSYGQFEIPLVFTNTGARACRLVGVPGVDLHGPADPNGPVYSLPRVDDGDKDTLAAPGASSTAHLVVLPWTEGSEGSAGSGKWVPTQLVTTPPGQTIPLTVAWPNGISVLRQDMATHPGSSVHGLTVRA
ncbi:DUF4232 domain-containing protein [Amycolatopsis sp. OK19-0408]|uniref:DUF4232 domain-containing protein n=1 Tax=Amycolatopsis iheyensis TaxID=2945988 RepID=A0A9X2NHH6_9PSEU|nr:DUF4232 domain-containing protein [Amycolatopsis iheyensis]MCR6487491.1 DUF4232 domain-containing protein [Amycolatopsis iheyensis]